MPETISATFGLDVSPLRKGFQEAEAAAKAGGARVERALQASSARASQSLRGIMGGGTGAHFDAMAERRRRNSAAGFAPARPGQYLPLEESGGGRGGGTGIGGARLFRTFLGLSGITAAFGLYEQAVDALMKRRADLQSITHGPGSGGFRSEGDIQSNLSGTTAQLAALRDSRARNTSGILHPIVGAISDALTGDSPEERHNTRAALMKQASGDIDAMARHQGLLNEAEEQSLTGSQRKSAELKEQVRWMSNLYELSKAESAAGIQNPAARRAENERHNLADSSIANAAAMKDREFEAEKNIALIGLDNRTSEQERLGIAKERLDTLQKIQDIPKSFEEDRQLTGVQIPNAQMALRAAQFDAADQSPEAVTARNAANLQALRRQAFNSRMADAEDPNRAAYGAIVSGIGAVGPQSAGEIRSGLPKPGQDRGPAGKGEFKDVVKAIQDLQKEFTNTWK